MPDPGSWGAAIDLDAYLTGRPPASVDGGGSLLLLSDARLGP